MVCLFYPGEIGLLEIYNALHNCFHLPSFFFGILNNSESLSGSVWTVLQYIFYGRIVRFNLSEFLDVFPDEWIWRIFIWFQKLEIHLLYSKKYYAVCRFLIIMHLKCYVICREIHMCVAKITSIYVSNIFLVISRDTVSYMKIYIWEYKYNTSAYNPSLGWIVQFLSTAFYTMNIKKENSKENGILKIVPYIFIISLRMKFRYSMKWNLKWKMQTLKM